MGYTKNPMIQIVLKNDKWHILWATHIFHAMEAVGWCNDTFGSGWGEFRNITTNFDGRGEFQFVFHRLSHAQWFQLRWGTI